MGGAARRFPRSGFDSAGQVAPLGYQIAQFPELAVQVPPLAPCHRTPHLHPIVDIGQDLRIGQPCFTVNETAAPVTTTARDMLLILTDDAWSGVPGLLRGMVRS